MLQLGHQRFNSHMLFFPNRIAKLPETRHRLAGQTHSGLALSCFPEDVDPRRLDQPLQTLARFPRSRLPVRLQHFVRFKI